jgi:hypothetical protein
LQDAVVGVALTIATLAAACAVAGAGWLGWWRAARAVDRSADERARLLVELVGEAMTIPDDVGAADDVVRRLGQALDADAAAVGLASGNVLRLLGLWGYGPHMRTSRLAPGEGLSGQAWLTGRPLVVDDVERAPRYVAGAPGMRSGAYVPGRAGDSVVTVLAVETRRPAAYDEDDVRLMQPVADLIATMLASRRVLRDAAEVEDRLLPLVGLEVRPALREATEALDAAREAGSPAQRRAAVAAGLRSARRLEHLLESILVAASVSGGREVKVGVVPLARAVVTAVAAAGVEDRVDVAVPADLRVVADEEHLVHALRELLGAVADEAPTVRASVTARQVAEEVRVELGVPQVDGLRPHVARRLVEAMGGRLEPAWPHGLVVVLPPGRSGLEPPRGERGRGEPAW